ncbi:ArnT family glycosyltransferase [Parasphingorhabdus pacifica]
MHATLTPESTGTQEPRPFARWPVFSVAGLFAVVHGIFGGIGDYWFDEVYMLAAGKYHLAWGYVDQPPLVPALAAAMDWLAPGSLPMLRLPAILASTAAVVLCALIARELGGDRRAQVLTAAAFATGAWMNLVGHFLTPYTMEPLLWLVLTWTLVRWIRTRDDRLLLGTGAVVGVTLETKFQVGILCVVLLGAVLIAGPRAVLRRPLLWVGAGLALLIALPTLIWQAGHGWPQLRMASAVVAESELLSGGRSGTALTLVLYAGAAGTFLVGYGLWRLLVTPEHREHRFLGVTFLALYVLFVATAARPYYLIGLYGIAMAAGAVGLQRRRETKRTRRYGWLAWPAYALSIAVVVPVFPLTTQMSSLLGIPESNVLTRKVATAYHSLPAGAREHTAIMANMYGVAAVIDVRGEERGLPRAHSAHRGYGAFGPPDEDATSVLFVGREPSDVRPYFDELRSVGDDELEIWLLSGRTEPWTEIWPRIRHL